MEYVKKYARVFLNIIIPLLVIAIIWKWGVRIVVFFMPFIVGYLIAMIANPLVRFLENKIKIKRKHSSVIIVCLVLAIVLAIIYAVVFLIVVFVRDVYASLPEFYELVMEEIETIKIRFADWINLMPAAIKTPLSSINVNIGTYLGDIIPNMASPTVEVASGAVKSIPTALVYTVVTLLSAYFFIADRDKIYGFLDKYTPPSIKKYADLARNDIRKVIGGYFLAQFKIMFIVMSIMIVGFLILRVKYAVPLAILIAFLDFLPVLGTGTVLIPWAIIQLLTGDYLYGLALLVIYAITQIVRQIVQPKIVGDSMGMPALLTLICLFLGFKWKGIGGMILAVPIGLIVMKLFEYGVFDSLIENIKILINDIDQFRKKHKD